MNPHLQGLGQDGGCERGSVGDNVSPRGARNLSSQHMCACNVPYIADQWRPLHRRALCNSLHMTVRGPSTKALFQRLLCPAPIDVIRRT